MFKPDYAAYREITLNGLWKNNPGLVQLLGLCPLMAVTTNMVNGLGLGLATLMALVSSNVAISIVRQYISEEIRIPAFVLIIAANVTLIEMLMKAYLHDLYNILGIFIPLIVTNCIVIGRSEAYAAKNPPLHAGLDSFMMGVGFMLVLMALGGLRELVGNGTLFAEAHLMFGEAARHLTLTVSDDFKGLLLAALPPGAFIGLGLLVALKNWFDQRAARPATIAVMQPMTHEAA
ncbi:electron transport complex subunit E [Candidatus Thiothrix anitrata]|jgi:electron transport complex protein RnfE|uniref:Ion-translocating oxidoreductase complex subunit E n=1 Tax=Candidatus Thiothrix anitrata TaxID=2823902 RepID=A0ABX7X676_9GAMM|nr:electron transport complex subunit E [Candidatus Thiothrix anitrata]QTR50103.1 electron transport complex subunit E [Candidatus Thiothrix anitrata]